MKRNIGVVLKQEKERCRNCRLCKKIVEREPTIEAENKINAKVGDKVIVEINENVFLKISFFQWQVRHTDKSGACPLHI